jgi:hypothetical protein
MQETLLRKMRRISNDRRQVLVTRQKLSRCCCPIKLGFPFFLYFCPLYFSFYVGQQYFNFYVNAADLRFNLLSFLFFLFFLLPCLDDLSSFSTFIFRMFPSKVESVGA